MKKLTAQQQALQARKDKRKSILINLFETMKELDYSTTEIFDAFIDSLDHNETENLMKYDIDQLVPCYGYQLVETSNLFIENKLKEFIKNELYN
jgi:hypothetical protein